MTHVFFKMLKKMIKKGFTTVVIWCVKEIMLLVKKQYIKETANSVNDSKSLFHMFEIR